MGRTDAEGARVPGPDGADVLTAGGVVRRKVNGRDRVAVVRRNGHGGNWTLPKGHCAVGETLESAAVREVREETGWVARPRSLLGATSHATEAGRKYVLFWTMDAEEPVPSGPAQSEVDAVEWLSYREACRRLSCPKEVDLLARYARTRRAPRMRFASVFRDIRPERLQEEIEATWSSLGLMRARGQGAEPAWYAPAERLVRASEAAFAAGDIDRGWGLVLRAHELEVCGYEDAQVSAEAIALRAELASTKFNAWRRDAMRQQLDEVLAWNAKKNGWSLAPHERQLWLASALRTRHDSYLTEYQNVHLVRRYQAILLTVAVLILLSALIGSVFANPAFDSGIDKWWVVLGAALSGALGGITSAFQRTTRRSLARIPERLGSLVHSLSRPIIGAIAGMTVLLAVRAGITQTDSATEQQVAYLLLLAFGAGFSERLVVRDPREELEPNPDSARLSVPSAAGRAVTPSRDGATPTSGADDAPDGGNPAADSSTSEATDMASSTNADTPATEPEKAPGSS